jgi:hypothetical protein
MSEAKRSEVTPQEFLITILNAIHNFSSSTPPPLPPDLTSPPPPSCCSRRVVWVRSARALPRRDVLHVDLRHLRAHINRLLIEMGGFSRRRRATRFLTFRSTSASGGMTMTSGHVLTGEGGELC